MFLGFGYDLAVRCVKEGMIVFAGCYLPDTPKLLKEHCQRLPGKLSPFFLEVSSQDSVNKALKFVEDRLAVGQGLHAIVNNAAIVKVGFDDWITAEDFEACLKVNTFGSIRVTEKFKNLVKRAKSVFCFD